MRDKRIKDSERGIDMTDRIINQDKIGELAKALALARVQFPDIPKNQTVKVKTKSGGSYSFDFADLASLLHSTRQALSENGLAIIQQPAVIDTRFVLETILAHESGAAIISHHQLPDYIAVKSSFDVNSAMQTMGSAITFAKRYAMSAILGIAAQDDDDANMADGNDYQHNSGQKSQQQQNRENFNAAFENGGEPPPQEDAITSTAAKGCFACADTLRIPKDVFDSTLYETFKVESKKAISLLDWERMHEGLQSIVYTVTKAVSEFGGHAYNMNMTSEEIAELDKAVEEFVIYLNETPGEWKEKSAALRDDTSKGEIFGSFTQWKQEQAVKDEAEKDIPE